MNPLLLITGPSGSGKSTLALAIAAELRLPCISLDAYYIRGAKAFVETPAGPIRTFERPTLYNGSRLATALFNRTCGMVAEGFCLLTYPEISALPAARYYLDVPFHVCLARRLARRPKRPSDRSFTLVGERESSTFVLPQRTMPGVCVLDGLKPIAELVEILRLRMQPFTDSAPP